MALAFHFRNGTSTLAVDSAKAAKVRNQVRTATSVEGRYWRDVTCGGVTNIPRDAARHMITTASYDASPPTTFWSTTVKHLLYAPYAPRNRANLAPWWRARWPEGNGTEPPSDFSCTPSGCTVLPSLADLSTNISWRGPMPAMDATFSGLATELELKRRYRPGCKRSAVET